LLLSAANSRANSQPIPDDAPVMRAVSDDITNPSSWDGRRFASLSSNLATKSAAHPMSFAGADQPPPSHPFAAGDKPPRLMRMEDGGRAKEPEQPFLPRRQIDGAGPPVGKA
jgi:hypothetical protein